MLVGMNSGDWTWKSSVSHNQGDDPLVQSVLEKMFVAGPGHIAVAVQTAGSLEVATAIRLDLSPDELAKVRSCIETEFDGSEAAQRVKASFGPESWR